MRRRADQIRLRDTGALARLELPTLRGETEHGEAATEAAGGRGPGFERKDGFGSSERRLGGVFGEGAGAGSALRAGPVEHDARLAPFGADALCRRARVDLQGQILLDIVEGVREAAQELVVGGSLHDGRFALFESVHV